VKSEKQDSRKLCKDATVSLFQCFISRLMDAASRCLVESVLFFQFRKACIGEGIRPRRAINFGEAVLATFIIGAEPSNPPK